MGRKMTLGQNQNTSCTIRLKLMKTLTNNLETTVIRYNVHEPIEIIDIVNFGAKNLTDKVRHIYVTFVNLKYNMNYVISLGPSCFGSYMCKRQGLKRFSCPFDWTAMSDPEYLIDILETDFKHFLDSSQYIDHADKENNRAGHKRYGEWFFCHFNPRIKKEYDYYVRCVERFRTVMKKPNVLYVMHLRPGQTVNTEKLLKLLGPDATLFICHHIVTGRCMFRILEKGPRVYRIEARLVDTWKHHLTFSAKIEEDRFNEIFFSLFTFDLKEWKERNGDLYYELRNVSDLTIPS